MFESKIIFISLFPSLFFFFLGFCRAKWQVVKVIVHELYLLKGFVCLIPIGYVMGQMVLRLDFKHIQ